MNLEIHLEITLPTGAVITVTDDQLKTITEFIEKVITGAEVKEKRTKELGSRRWTPEETQLVLDELGKLENRDKVKGITSMFEAILPLAQRLGRTRKSLIAHYQKNKARDLKSNEIAAIKKDAGQISQLPPEQSEKNPNYSQSIV